MTREAITLADLQTHLVVEGAIEAEAKRLCSRSCRDTTRGKPCRACNAVIHGWRPNAIASLRRAARRSERESAQ